MLKILRSQQGSVITLIALTMSVLIGFTAVVVDIGLLLANRAQLVNTADAAALAGAQDLPGDVSAAKASAEAYAARNGRAGDNVAVTVASDKLGITTTVSRRVDLFFARIFGIFSSDIGSSAQVVLSPLSAYSGIVPFGVVKQEFVFGQRYTLKEGAGGGYEGNYGALALGGTGSINYRENIMNGYKNKIKIGDWLLTETGNMSGATREGVGARIGQDLGATFETVATTSPRIVVIPVIDSLPGNGRGEVLVVGFAAFYLEGAGGNGQDSYVTGRFLKLAIPGDGNGSSGYGAYATRLVK